MKDNDWQFLRHFPSRLMFPFLVFPYVTIMYRVTLATDFLLLSLLHCYSQVATICTFSSDCSVKHLFSNVFVKPKKKLPIKVVVPKLQETILYGTRRDVQLEHFIALHVPTSQQRLRLTWFFTYLRKIQECEQKTHTSRKFVCRNSLAFMRYENTGAVKMEFR